MENNLSRQGREQVDSRRGMLTVEQRERPLVSPTRSKAAGEGSPSCDGGLRNEMKIQNQESRGLERTWAVGRLDTMVRYRGGETDPVLHTGKSAKLSWGRRHLLWEKGMTFLFENGIQQGAEGVVLGSPG